MWHNNRAMKELKLNITYFKMLDTIDYLNQMDCFPLPEGVYKIVGGIVDEETINYMDCPTFGTLVSFGSKKVCRYLLMLQRHGYIQKIFHRASNNLYLSITDKGKAALLTYHKKHKAPYIKKKREVKKTIVSVKK